MHQVDSVTHADDRKGSVFSAVCLFFALWFQKPMHYQNWHTNVPRWILDSQLFWSRKVKGQGHETQKSIADVGHFADYSDAEDFEGDATKSMGKKR